VKYKIENAKPKQNNKKERNSNGKREKEEFEKNNI
jgi:hypothetical protein